MLVVVIEIVTMTVVVVTRLWKKRVEPEQLSVLVHVERVELKYDLYSGLHVSLRLLELLEKIEVRPL